MGSVRTTNIFNSNSIMKFKAREIKDLVEKIEIYENRKVDSEIKANACKVIVEKSKRRLEVLLG